MWACMIVTSNQMTSTLKDTLKLIQVGDGEEGGWDMMVWWRGRWCGGVEDDVVEGEVGGGGKMVWWKGR